MSERVGSAITVLGAGSWGTALAMLLARNGHEVKLWDRDSGHVEALNQQRENRRYLPGISLPDRVTAFADLHSALEGTTQRRFPRSPEKDARSPRSDIQPHLGQQGPGARHRQVPAPGRRRRTARARGYRRDLGTEFCV